MLFGCWKAKQGHLALTKKDWHFLEACCIDTTSRLGIADMRPAAFHRDDPWIKEGALIEY